MNNKINEIKEENNIIFIYFILLFIYLYANSIELNYLKYENIEDKELYRTLLYIVFGISLFISLYYLINSIQELNEHDENNIYTLKILSTLSNLLIVIATLFYLYIIYKDKNINLEISP